MPTECHKTELAMIDHIAKEMTNAEEIKWALKHEEECNFCIEAPKTKDKEGKPKSRRIATQVGD